MCCIVGRLCDAARPPALLVATEWARAFFHQLMCVPRQPGWFMSVLPSDVMTADNDAEPETVRDRARSAREASIRLRSQSGETLGKNRQLRSESVRVRQRPLPIDVRSLATEKTIPDGYRAEIFVVDDDLMVRT